ncbi:MAG: hypothetical protein Q9223_003142 [Gallowayella weberi]
MKFLLAFLLAPLAATLAISSDLDPFESSPILERQAANVAAGTTAQPTFTVNQLWNLNKKFLDSFIYPANVKVARAINSTLLAEDVQGRVDITRTFDGRELNTEYLFGLFANLATAEVGAISLLGIPLSYEVLHFAASQNIATALTRFQFNFTALNLVIPVEIDTWNSYNSRGQITQYDATFKYWQWTVDYLMQAAGKKFGTTSTEATVGTLTKAIAQSICGTATKYCSGPNEQYTSPAQCLDYLTTNTLLCRMVHQNMVAFRPEVHCPHIGKTGGGYCDDDKTYLQTIGENYFERSPFVPFGLKGQGGGTPDGGNTAGGGGASAGPVTN